ncbi:3-hydroxy-3-methylglutaryl-coenzyme A reductase-like isoform X2 [Oppia nitens]|uniref:3-hydroxy-3-methylglutaryl-coenzyme A reductase-like isoform X2 n=1 Tax=Oppia nitens TaxID=1686743 RepID=UPI0023DBD212|nr:3-hydroxy-3-methylglutaryl-coenzyme A reductase-like isoform X2 [Oppia nitens]
MGTFRMTSGRMSGLFYTYGKVCASHPCEVMVAFFTLLLICIFSLGSQFLIQTNTYSSGYCLKKSGCIEELELKSAESFANTITLISRCLAFFYIYQQFKNLYNLGSKYLVQISALFTVLSSFIFCSTVLYALNANFTELIDALPFFLLLSDLSKASLLAQFALSSNTREEVRENIARGMAILGPTLTLDTLVETLAIGVGTVSGVSKLEEISCFACLSVIVNYVVFMILFPAYLSLALELSYNRGDNLPVWQLSSLAKVLLESEKAPNPVIQRIKLIMSAALMLVHTLSRFPIGSETDTSTMGSNFKDSNHDFFLDKEPTFFENWFRKYLTLCSEQVVMIGLVFALAVKYIFFENKDYYNEHIKHQYQQEMQQTINKRSQVVSENSVRTQTLETPRILVTTQDSDTESMIHERTKKCQKSDTFTDNSLKDDVCDNDEKISFIIGDDCSSDMSETELVDREVQTDDSYLIQQYIECQQNTTCAESKQIRDINTLLEIYNKEDGTNSLTDLEILYLVDNQHIPAYKLESILGNAERGVAIRRRLIEKSSKKIGVIEKIPYTQYDYSLVLGACCENVVGYIPVPLGIAGPLLLNNNQYYVPMATTEGCLVASTNRGCRALVMSGGVNSAVYKDGMTRGPVIHFPTAIRSAEAMKWLQEDKNFERIKLIFDSTSRFARLQRIHPRVAGRYLYLRFIGSTGDAMGMNMLSKGTELAIQELIRVFPDIQATCLSGNFCTDKKAAAVNWIEGRGKSVVCEAVVPAKVIEKVLKTSAEALVELNISKNLVGSSMAGTIGGNNAHAANIVAAIYIACGQDPAQTVGSSNCITLMEINGNDLHISCTMPSIEIGTIGGGTVLQPQSACLELLGVKGCSAEIAGSNSSEFATIVCATVLAAELSLMSALAAGHLVRSHMKHNRSNININATTVPQSSTDLLKSVPNSSQ